MKNNKYVITYWMIIDASYKIAVHVAKSEDEMIKTLSEIKRSENMELISVVVN